MNLHARVCPCGSLRFTAALVMFPLHWTTKCSRCGRPDLLCAMKTDKPAPVIKRVPPPEDDGHYWGPWA